MSNHDQALDFWVLLFKQTPGEAAELAIKRSVSCAGPRLGADRRPSKAGHREPWESLGEKMITDDDIDRCSQGLHCEAADQLIIWIMDPYGRN